jgi:hypothetical protein
VYGAGLYFTIWHLAAQFVTVRPGVALVAPKAVFAWPLLVGGIYLMHAFCWYLGLAYRKYHEKFPWVFQRHIPQDTTRRHHPNLAEAMEAGTRISRLRRQQPRGFAVGQPALPKSAPATAQPARK